MSDTDDNTAAGDKPETRCNWAVVVPLANEEAELPEFVSVLAGVLDELKGGTVYFVVDHASKDRTLDLCRRIELADPRFVTEWTPENRNVVDAYINGFRAALRRGHEVIIEMDAGLSHDPRAIPLFLAAISDGYDCAFGSRYISGGSMADSPFRRRFLSRGGTILARWLLDARLTDMTSGFQAFRRDVLEQLTRYPLRSRAHFYQTEVRYLLRGSRHIEIPIHYRAPSPRVSRGAIINSMLVLARYTVLRLSGVPPILRAKATAPSTPK